MEYEYKDEYVVVALPNENSTYESLMANVDVMVVGMKLTEDDRHMQEESDDEDDDDDDDDEDDDDDDDEDEDDEDEDEDDDDEDGKEVCYLRMNDHIFNGVKTSVMGTMLLFEQVEGKEKHRYRMKSNHLFTFTRASMMPIETHVAAQQSRRSPARKRRQRKSASKSEKKVKLASDE
jgi:hypothetical protein